ncbi:superoxide dismutase [Neorhizobium sp. NCHU2750]|uniref:superoxide dismutase n=1 Tax=Neorhizobium sp. NCHU2750 TaxID=1825976 RepID=UPI000E756CC8|nr:superoxide dismutase [Neorhizobium sp. NCHU2750]
MAFELPELPYAYDALAPLGMSEETLKLHHDLHHKAYVDNGNKAVAGTQWENMSLEQAVVATYHAGVVNQSPLFNNLSQHWNHNLFWEIMSPEQVSMPDNLGSAIVQSFGSIENFRNEFVTTGVSQFGSGWVWLIRDDAAGILRVVKTENGVNPLCHGHKTLLGCDVWEHSYYVDFRNKRPAYIENFIDKLVDWNAVAARL